MQIVRRDADALNIKIQLTLEPVDYADKFKSEIQKLKNKVQIKGFRKGKTPEAVIRKMYGKSVLLDVINDTLLKNLTDYIQEQNFNYVGQPLPDKDENQITDLDINQLKEYVFSFDMGLVPDFEIAGVSESDTYDYFDVDITDEMAVEEVESARKRMGTHSDVDDNIEENDIVTFEASELEGDALKIEGWKTTFSVLVNMVKDEDVRKQLLELRKDDTIRFDIYDLEAKDEAHVQKYLLHLPEDSDHEVGRMFEGKIIQVSRVLPAELTEDFFSSFGQEDIKDETSLTEFLKQDLKRFFDQQASQLMQRSIMNRIMESNDFDMPVDFLKKYLKATNEGVSDADLENEFEPFIKNLKWSLIKSKLAGIYGVKIEEQDIKNHFINKLFEYTRSQGMMDYGFIMEMADKMMKNEKQVNQAYEEILAHRILYQAGENVTKNTVSLSAQEFENKVKELNESSN